MRKLTVISLALLLVTLLGSAAIAGGADEWGQYQKDAQHVGAIDLSLPDTNNVSRRTDNIGAVDGSQPVVAGDKAYVYTGVAGTSGAIYCYNLITGAKVWNTAVAPVSANVSWSSPAVTDGVVYIGSGSKVQALDAADGDILWTRDLEAINPGAQVVNSSPAVVDGRLVIGDFGNGCYYCLDTSENGKLLWTFDLEASCMAMSTACIAGDRVFVGQGAAFGAPVTPNGKVWCVNLASGDAISSWGTGGSFTTVGKQDMTGTVTAFGDFIYFTDFTYGAATEPNCYLYCLRAQTGAEAWKVPVFGSDGAPSVVDGYIVTSGQAAGAWPAPGVNWTTCVSADTTTGTTPEQVWTRSGIGGNTMSACIANDRIAVGTGVSGWPPFTATDLYVLKASDGSTVWHSTEAGSPPVATPYGLLSLGDGKMITFGGGTAASDFYFAEGTTRDGYQEWICLENPTDTATDAEIDYMTDTGQTATQGVRLEPMTRTTIDVNLFMGTGLDVSAHVHGPGRFVA
ncbi:MAG: PQQ-binding-like beta-propeller repeat protein [Actinobacteria bacterium]|nr:PQQ-binding-like beta-propeller repeat protein [Actinomycetota bacterium]